MSNADCIKRYGMQEEQMSLLDRAGIAITHFSAISRYDSPVCRVCDKIVTGDGLRINASHKQKQHHSRFSWRNYHGRCVGKSPSVRMALKAAGLLESFDALAAEIEQQQP